jgi:hypothetical protein
MNPNPLGLKKSDTFGGIKELYVSAYTFLMNRRSVDFRRVGGGGC